MIDFNGNKKRENTLSEKERLVIRIFSPKLDEQEAIINTAKIVKNDEELANVKRWIESCQRNSADLRPKQANALQSFSRDHF